MTIIANQHQTLALQTFSIWRAHHPALLSMLQLSRPFAQEPHADGCLSCPAAADGASSTMPPEVQRAQDLFWFPTEPSTRLLASLQSAFHNLFCTDQVKKLIKGSRCYFSWLSPWHSLPLPSSHTTLAHQISYHKNLMTSNIVQLASIQWPRAKVLYGAAAHAWVLEQRLQASSYMHVTHTNTYLFRMLGQQGLYSFFLLKRSRWALFLHFLAETMDPLPACLKFRGHGCIIFHHLDQWFNSRMRARWMDMQPSFLWEHRSKLRHGTHLGGAWWS